MSLRRRNSQKRMKRKLKEQKKKETNDDGEEEDKKDKDADDDLLDEMEEEIDEVLANLVKVECEYLLPFLCDVFDLMFERRKEIEIDDLLEYFVGLYQVPAFVTVSDHEEENKDADEFPESKTESKNITETANSRKGTESVS